jgi:patatin-related protein
MSSAQTSRGADKPPSVDFNQEIRFAVVMYGGASLAIYINGVAQELLRMVRATAPEPGVGGEVGERAQLADVELKGSEVVYRRLGRMLSRGESAAENLEAAGDGADLRTRFVVDILTGTSAGGINAVYLAKALTNGQNMNELKKLWVTEGDIGALINDDSSYKKLGIGERNEKPFEDEPFSLLNSRRMYVKLLDALRGMDYPKRKDAASACPQPADDNKGGLPLVDDLDLYVTTTDISGKVIQMRLADDVVAERRHRNVFHFRYRSGWDEHDPHVNEFESQYNAFLAFAARATSAHQAAFSPIKLEDMHSILKKYPLEKFLEVIGREAKGAPDEYDADDERLRVFYRDYLMLRAGEDGKAGEVDPAKLAKDFRGVWFNDGGSLDNKPFTFVFEELPLRQASAAVDRKLLYVEPSPEHLKFERAAKKRPQIIQNAWGGLSTLPSYETIVQDLTRVLERNRLIERVRHITNDIEDDIKSRHSDTWQLPRKREEMAGLKVEQLIAEKGAAWGGYQRLRIAQVTDDLTLLIARAAGIDEDSDEYTAIRQLVRHWRTETYDDHDDSKKAEIGFLLDYDLQWTVRRVRFVLRKLDELSCFDEHAEKLAKLTEQTKRQITVTWPKGGDDPKQTDEQKKQQDDLKKQLRTDLRKMREKLSKVLARLNAASRSFWAYRDDTVYTNPFREEVIALGVTGEMLLDFLKVDEADRKKFLDDYLKDETHKRNFGALVEEVKTRFVAEIEASRTACYSLLHEYNAPAHLDSAKSVSYILYFYFRFFEDFDQVSFPIFYSTDVGEEMDAVEVFRVSPEDARSIINEKKDKHKDEKSKPMLKLAGTTLGHFGAFFERKFRINDIMWGRLDGAERIIAALLPLPKQKNLRDKLTKEAHLAIIEDEAENKITLACEQAQEVFGSLTEAERGGGSGARLHGKVLEAVGLMLSGDDCGQVLKDIKDGAANLGSRSRWRSFLEAFVIEFELFSSKFIVPRKGGADPLEAFKVWFKAQYEEGRQFSPDATVESAVRANRVLGGMALGELVTRGHYSKEEKDWTWKQWIPVWLGERVQIFTEAAIQTDSPAYHKLRRRLIICYIISLLLFVGVLLLRGTEIFSTVAIIIGLIVALIPLALTVGYHVAWRKFKGLLASVLPKH